MGAMYSADTDKNLILRFEPDGTITTVAGVAEAGYAGDGGPAIDASFRRPFVIAVAYSGEVIVADWGNNRLRAFRPGGTIRTVAGNGTRGYSGDGGDATRAQLNGP